MTAMLGRGRVFMRRQRGIGDRRPQVPVTISFILIFGTEKAGNTQETVKFVFSKFVVVFVL